VACKKKKGERIDSIVAGLRDHGDMRPASRRGVTELKLITVETEKGYQRKENLHSKLNPPEEEKLK